MTCSRSMARTGGAIALAVLLACAGAGPAREAAPAPPAGGDRAATEWYDGRRFLWLNVFTQERYDRAAANLSPDDRAAMARRHRFDLYPLDVRAGDARPRLSYVYAKAGSLDEYARIRGLAHLDLSGYGGRDPLAPIAPSPASALTLPETGLTDEAIGALLRARGSLPNLAHLDVTAGKGRVTPRVLAHLAGRDALRSLQLSGADVTDEWLAAAVAELPNLRALRLHRTAVTDHGLARLSRLAGLSHLAIEGRTGPGEAGLRVLAELPALRELQVSGPWVADDVVAGLSRSQTVERVVIDDAGPTAAAARALTAMRRLNTVVLATPDADVLAVLERWKRADPKARRYFARPEPAFGGWVGELDVVWMSPRAVEPENFP